MEATIVCVDNSEWTRNGDYTPDRFQAQADAANLLARAKTQANAESAVGILTMGGRAPRMLVTPTSDLSKVLNCLAQINIEGEEANLSASVQVAQLALKHRPNKNQRQRIVIFAGSPVVESKDALVKTAKKLKKNNVAVDIVSFGCTEENEDKLQAFHNAVQSSDNSNYIAVPGGSMLSDALIGTPVFQGDGVGGFGGAGGSGAGEGYEFGDPSVDPEMELALRLSMEEERARQTRAAQEAAAKSGAKEGTSAEAGKTEETAVKDTEQDAAAKMDVDEDPILQEALAISMAAYPDAQETGQGSGSGAAGDVAMGEEDPDFALALQLSMQESAEQAGGAGTNDLEQVAKDSNYVSSVLSSLPGVNPDDPMVKNAIANLKKDKEDDEKDQDKDKDKSKE